jgi:RNA polymerase sigma factor (sigma-70 family)
MSESDRGLIRACLAGDRKAWATLVARYERLLYAIPQKYGLSEEDAADVAQTVCVRLVQNLEKLRDEEHLTSWLILAAKRESWRVAGQRKRDVPFSSLAPGETGESPVEQARAAGALPDEEAIRLEQEDLLEMALQELDERCRRLLELLYQTDPSPSYDELAVLMQMPRGALGPTRARCLSKLQKHLVRLGF